MEPILDADAPALTQLGLQPLAQRLVRGKKGVTAQSLFKRSRKPRIVGSALEALNILYVLVALDRAKFDQRHKSIQLFFNIDD